MGRPAVGAFLNLMSSLPKGQLQKGVTCAGNHAQGFVFS